MVSPIAYCTPSPGYIVSVTKDEDLLGISYEIAEMSPTPLVATALQMK